MRNKVLLAIGLAIALFVGGYTTGRAHGPSVVQTKDKVVQTTKIAESVHSAATDARTSQKDVATDVVTIVKTIKRPDGTIETERRTEDKTKSEVKAAEVKTVIVEKIKEVQVVKIEEHTKLIVNRPNWALSLDAGFSIPGALGKPSTNYLPSALPSYLRTSAVFGLSLERRLFGDLYGGLHVNTQGVVGLQLRLAF